MQTITSWDLAGFVRRARRIALIWKVVHFKTVHRWWLRLVHREAAREVVGRAVLHAGWRWKADDDLGRTGGGTGGNCDRRRDDGAAVSGAGSLGAGRWGRGAS